MSSNFKIDFLNLLFSGTSFIWFAVDVVFLLSYFRCRDAQCTLEDWSSFWAPSETLNSDVTVHEDVGGVFGESSQVYPDDQVGGVLFMFMIKFAKSFAKIVLM